MRLGRGGESVVLIWLQVCPPRHYLPLPRRYRARTALGWKFEKWWAREVPTWAWDTAAGAWKTEIDWGIGEGEGGQVKFQGVTRQSC